MGLGMKLGGYLSAVKKKDKKKYQKWVDAVQASGDSVTGRVERLLISDLKHGVFDLDEKAKAGTQEQKEIKKLEENVSIAGAINKLVEAMTVNNIQVVQQQQAQLQQMGIDPLKAEIENMAAIKQQNAAEIEQQQNLYGEVLTKKKAQDRLLREQEERLRDAQSEYAQLQAKIQTKKVEQFSGQPAVNQDVPVRTEDYKSVPPKRDSKGHFLPRSESGVPAYHPGREGEGSD